MKLFVRILMIVAVMVWAVLLTGNFAESQVATSSQGNGTSNNVVVVAPVDPGVPIVINAQKVVIKPFFPFFDPFFNVDPFFFHPFFNSSSSFVDPFAGVSSSPLLIP